MNLCNFPKLLLRWLGLVGQFRPRKLLSTIKKGLTSSDDMDLSSFKDIGKHFFDKSLYALGFFSQLSLTDDTSLLFNVERHGERKAPRSKAVLFHKVISNFLRLSLSFVYLKF